MLLSDAPCSSGATPVVLSQRNVCNPGFLCNNNSEDHPPEYCPPTPACLITRLELVKNICDEPQGVYEPMVCPPGHFCDNQGKAISLCPRGHFCPLGTATPLRCGSTSVCPQGADREFVLDGFIALFAIDLLLFILLCKPSIVLVLLSRVKGIHDVPDQKRPRPVMDVESQSVRDGNIPKSYDPTREAIRDFVASVRACIGLGNIEFSFRFEDLSSVLPSGKTIVAPQSGEIPPGCVWGVMGPSGAGKTSFVNLLVGKTQPTTGSISVNGVTSQIMTFKKLIGYVPQDDVIMPECTVRENILHSAMARLPRTWSDTQRIRHVEILLACLNLTDVEHRIVGTQAELNISGGQRKRVSIGLELSAAPLVLVLDEPTSGLDATASLFIMDLLQALSRQGVTIICILHQPRPEILDFIDGITLLHKGHQLYHGKTRSLPSYFSTLGLEIPDRINLADAALDIISGRSADYSPSTLNLTVESLAESWAKYYHYSRSTPNRNAHDQVTSTPEQLNAIIRSATGRGLARHRQAYFCFKRSVKQQLICRSSFLLEIAVSAVAGLLIGLSLYQLRGQHFQGVYYPPFQLLSSALNYTTVPEIGLLCNTAIGLASAAPGVKIFGEEKQIYWREAAAGHSRSAYYFGKTIATIPRIAIAALHFTSFYCVLATPWMSFWKMYLTNLLYFYCIYGLAAAVSMIVRREDGPLLAMIASLIIGVFGGYGPPLYNVKEWHLEWFWRLCPGIWFTEAYFDQHLIGVAHLYDLEAAAHWTGYVRGRFGLDLVLLVIIGTIYRIAAYGGLVGLNRSKQV